MKIRVIKLGRIAYRELRSLALIYQERLAALAKPAQIESLEVRDEESLERLLLKPESQHLLILLDEKGKQPTSKEFAADLQARLDDPGVKSMTFVIGDPMGLSEALRKRSKLHMALSKATMTSDFAWALLWEQLYRAFSILKGTSYHHE